MTKKDIKLIEKKSKELKQSVLEGLVTISLSLAQLEQNISRYKVLLNKKH